MSSGFNSIRFILFTQSYSGFFLAGYINNSSRCVSELNNVAKALLFKKFMLKRFIFEQKYRKPVFRLKVEHRCVTSQKVSLYLQIEHELCTLHEMKKDREKFTEFEYENSGMFLDLAIERVAGNNLKNLESDVQFDSELPKLIKTYRHWYYTVAYTYKLPTVRIIPFILRLIS